MIEGLQKLSESSVVIKWKMEKSFVAIARSSWCPTGSLTNTDSNQDDCLHQRPPAAALFLEQVPSHSPISSGK